MDSLFKALKHYADMDMATNLLRCPITELAGWVDAAKNRVMILRPNAQLCHIEDRRHELLAVGVFDFAIVLNERFNFQLKNQHSPQLISDLYEFKHSTYMSTKVVFLKQLSAWRSAFDKLIASDNRPVVGTPQTHPGIYES